MLTAYRPAWDAFERALAGANPTDPSLATTMVDSQLQGVRANLVSYQRHGEITDVYVIERHQVTSNVLAMTVRASMARCASAACSSGNVCPMTGRMRPSAAAASAFVASRTESVGEN
jgi:hypothetical protein